MVLCRQAFICNTRNLQCHSCCVYIPLRGRTSYGCDDQDEPSSEASEAFNIPRSDTSGSSSPEEDLFVRLLFYAMARVFQLVLIGQRGDGRAVRGPMLLGYRELDSVTNKCLGLN